MSQPPIPDLGIEFTDKINFYGIMNNENISDEIKEFCRMFI